RLRGLGRELDRLPRGREELLRRARRVGEPELGQREVRVLGQRLLEHRARIGGPQLLHEVAALQVELPGLVRRGNGEAQGGKGADRGSNGGGKLLHTSS